MKRKILLIGSTGFLGKKLKKKLRKKYSILAPSSKKLNLLELKSLNDFFNKKKIDIIINSAWIKNSTTENISKRNKNYLLNLKMAKNIIKISQKYKIKYFLNISSVNVYNYSSVKLKEKNLLLKKSYQSKISDGLVKLYYIKLFDKINKKNNYYKNLIFSNIYGYTNRKKNLLLLDKLFHNIYRKKKYTIKFFEKSKSRIDLIYIDDAVNAVIYFLDKLIKNRFFHQYINIGYGKNYKVNLIIKKILKKSKINIKYSNLNLKSKKNLIPSIALAKRYGWEAKIGIDEGLKKTKKDYLSLKS